MVWLYCENGPCSGEVAVNVGDDTHLERRGVGVNQRAMKNAGACKNGSGQSITSGECYCGPMSASGAEAMLGLVPATTEDIQANAKEIFSATNTSSGAADKNKLAQHFEDAWGYTCSIESATMTGCIAAVKAGGPVLFRSKDYSSSGHYTFLTGCDVTTNKIMVTDPYGGWISKGKWDSNSKTNANDTKGLDRWYDFGKLSKSGDAQFIVCSPPTGEIDVCAGGSCGQNNADPQGNPATSACEHSVCSQGAALDAECDPCVATVCAQDPYCCENSYDEICAGEAKSMCGSTCNSSTTHASNTSNTSCSHSTCELGAKMNQGCNACVSQVCAQDSYCCQTAWDSYCVNESNSWCGGCF